MNLFSLDLASKTGWAMNVGCKRSVNVEFTLKRGESPGMRFLRCRAWLNEMLHLLGKIDVIVYEQAHHRGGAATACCVGLVTEVLAFAAEHGIETMSAHTATLKKFATGSGRAKKKDMMRAARMYGWDPADDNEADAELLLEYAQVELGFVSEIVSTVNRQAS